jgi:Trk-type K+ transport system membrane component
VVPNEPNIVKTHIKNEGSAPATGVIVNIVGRNQQEDLDNNNVIPTTSNNGNISTTTIQQSTVIPLISAGTTTFNLGTIPAGGSMQINLIYCPAFLLAAY